MKNSVLLLMTTLLVISGFIAGCGSQSNNGAPPSPYYGMPVGTTAIAGCPGPGMAGYPSGYPAGYGGYPGGYANGCPPVGYGPNGSIYPGYTYGYGNPTGYPYYPGYYGYNYGYGYGYGH